MYSTAGSPSNSMGRVGFLLSHGSLLLEAALEEYHATTPSAEDFGFKYILVVLVYFLYRFSDFVFLPCFLIHTKHTNANIL